MTFKDFSRTNDVLVRSLHWDQVVEAGKVSPKCWPKKKFQKENYNKYLEEVLLLERIYSTYPHTIKFSGVKNKGNDAAQWL